MDARPVGMFDSGVGGLSVLAEFRRLAPRERVIYFADTAYFPYGPRPAAEVRKRSFAIVNRLTQADVKMVVVACNTASAAAIDDLRQAWPDLPFVGMVPGLKPAAQASKSGVVAILATEGTLDGDLYGRVVDQFGRATKVLNVPGTGLAELVEHGDANGPRAHAAIREALERAVRDGADTVVLGCTHYHFLTQAIRSEFPGVAIVDTTEPVARRAVQLLEERDALAPPNALGELDIVVSGDRAAFRGIMQKLGFAPAPEVPA